MGLKNKTLKLLVHTVGRLSTGVDMSLKYGFTSGRMLDYIYRNQPSGRLLIGRLLDRMYLAHRGWESVRIRKRHLELMLERAVDEKLASGGRVLIVDVASGPARYILDTLAKYKGREVSAVCRDIDERWLREGRANAAARGLDSVRFEKGDALDPDSFAALPEPPQVVVSSGFYDWMEDDEMVKCSMRVARDFLEPGGFFVFTNQSGHVDLEMVNEVFIGFGGRPLRMKTRPAELMNAWAQDLGLTVEETRADGWGYYTVALARKQ